MSQRKLKLHRSKETTAEINGYRFTFRPASIRTDYTSNRGGGTPIATAQPTANDAWLIVSRSGEVVAVVQMWGSGDDPWTVSKVRGRIGGEYALASGMLSAGPTAVAAIEGWLS